MNNSFITIGKYVQPSWLLITFASFCSAINKVCDIIPEVLIGVAIDVVVRPEESVVTQLGIIDPANQLWFVGFLAALFWILESVFEYLYAISWRHIALSMQHQLRLQVYNRLQHADIAYIQTKTTGDMLHVVYDDINFLEKFFSQGPNEIIQLFVNTLLLGGIFFYVSPSLAMVTLFPMPFVMIIAYFFQNKLSQFYAHSRHMSSALAGHIVHRLHGIHTIKSYVTYDYELRLLEQQSNSYLKAQHDTHQLTALYIPIMRMVILIGFISTLIYGGMLALQGTIPINWYAMLVFLMQRFLWPFTTLTIIADMYESASACMQRILQILVIKPSLAQCYNACVVLEHAKGVVTFQNVSFAYQSGHKVLKNISLEISAKTSVAFVGGTGSGKSTLVNLLLRFYDPISGAISIDGKNIKTIDLASLRHLIGLVSQDIYMVEGTIADNIAYGSFEASRDEIIEVGRMAQAHDFIEKLPEGYDTKVLEYGKNLSGGQRQRIAIARVLLKKSPILVFDEATSAVDNETQAAIEQSMQRLSKNHTIIIIAHRLSTVRNVDTIFVLDHGVIVESGNHDELIKKNGLYARLHELQ